MGIPDTSPGGAAARTVFLRSPAPQEFLMLGSTAPPPPSPHHNYPAGILNGDVLLLPSPTGAGVLSPSTSASPFSLHPFLSSKNKGHVFEKSLQLQVILGPKILSKLFGLLPPES